MKIIVYNLCRRINRGTKTAPIYEEILHEVKLPWSEANESIAQTEARNGEYTIEDDDIAETPMDEAVSWDDLAEALREGVNEV